MKKILLNYLSVPTSMLELSINTGLNSYEIKKYIKELESDGYIFSKICDANGNVKLYLDTINKESKISIEPNSKDMKILILSDSHMGKIEYDGYFDLISNYIKENDIHIILFLGDIIDGVSNNDPSNPITIYKEIKEFIDKFPRIFNTTTIYILGNHDYSAYHFNNIDIRNFLDNRDDFLYAGLGLVNVNIGNDIVTLRHDLLYRDMPLLDEVGRVIFKGHSHKCNINENIIVVPALLDDSFYKNIMSRGFLEADFSFNEDNHIEKLLLKHLIFDKGNIRNVSENIVTLPNIKVKKNI